MLLARTVHASPRLLSTSSTPTPLTIIHETSDYFFLNKPSGIPVSGDTSTTNYHELAKYHAQAHYSMPHLNLLHRLDKDTSGVMVYAKHLDAAKHFLALQETKGAITKDYKAIVANSPPKPSGRISGGISLSLDKTSFVIRTKGSKRVLTTYKQLSTATHPRLGPLAGLSLRLVTGRKHQIRASCRHISCPIVGDTKYGGAKNSTMLLHAARCAFVGPEGEKYDVQCEPEWAADPIFRSLLNLEEE